MAIIAYKCVFNQANIVSILDFSVCVCESSDRGQYDERDSSLVIFSGLAGSSSSNRGVGSVRNPSLKQNEDAQVAGSHQSSFYTYEDYGG